MRIAPPLVVLFLGAGACSSEPAASDAGVVSRDAPLTRADAGDDAGAPAIDSGAIDSGAGPDTWSTFGTGFVEAYCVRCHSGPPSGRDYRTIDDVRRDAARIRCGVAPAGETQSGCTSPAPGMFPIGGGPFPSDEERRRFIAWIDAGLAE